MQLDSRYRRFFQSLLSLLSMVSCGLLFFILEQEVVSDQKGQYDHYPYWPLIAFACIFIINAINYWLLSNKYVKWMQNGLLVIELGFLLSSTFADYPVVLIALKSGLSIFTLICLFVTIVLGLIYLNLKEFTSPQRVILFVLKFFSCLVSLGAALFLFAFLLTSGNTYLALKPAQQTWVLIGMGLWIGLNIAEGIFIWFKAFRSWWAWLLSVLLVLETGVPVFYDAVLGKDFGETLLGVAIIVVVLVMTYMNNKDVKED